MMDLIQRIKEYLHVDDTDDASDYDDVDNTEDYYDDEDEYEQIELNLNLTDITKPILSITQ